MRGSSFSNRKKKVLIFKSTYPIRKRRTLSTDKISSRTNTHLIPGDEEGSNPRGEGTLAELEADGPAPIDHEVEPAVLLGHGVALRVEVLVADPHAHEATPRRGHDAAADDGGAAAKRGTLALSHFDI